IAGPVPEHRPGDLEDLPNWKNIPVHRTRMTTEGTPFPKAARPGADNGDLLVPSGDPVAIFAPWRQRCVNGVPARVSGCVGHTHRRGLGCRTRTASPARTHRTWAAGHCIHPSGVIRVELVLARAVG